MVRVHGAGHKHRGMRPLARCMDARFGISSPVLEWWGGSPGLSFGAYMYIVLHGVVLGVQRQSQVLRSQGSCTGHSCFPFCLQVSDGQRQKVGLRRGTVFAQGREIPGAGPAGHLAGAASCRRSARMSLCR